MRHHSWLNHLSVQSPRAAISAPIDDFPAPIINFLRDHAIEIPVRDGLVLPFSALAIIAMANAQ
jgi:hypothetical protein